MITHEREQDLAARIDAWDPETGDLPDDVALALDESLALRARFDDRFARWEAGPEATMPESVEARVLPATPRRRRSWLWVGVPSLLAAAAMLVVVPTAFLLVTPMGNPSPELGWNGQTRGLASEGLVTAEPVAGDGILDGRFDGPAATDPRVARLRLKSGEIDPWQENLEAERQLSADKRAVLESLESLESLGYIGSQDVRTGVERTNSLLAGKISANREYRNAEPVEPAAPADGFVHPGLGAWKSATAEPLSTFAVDVDRGSYTFVRRRLVEGFLPDPASVRVEEFVNAVPYDYPEPEEGPFTVQFEASPNPTAPGGHLVRIGVQGRHVTQRAPAHLTFLVDTSGSMQSEDRLPLVKSSLALLTRSLGDGDTVAIVTYAGSAGVALPPTPATDQRRILDALARLESGGSTAMGQGIELAYALAHDTLKPGHTNRVIIASDGDTNVGTIHTGTLSEMIRGYADRGITLTTLGFGEGNYQDDRMEQLANDGDGNYFYVDGPAEARRIFVDELASTLEVIAKDVKIQVEWNPAAVSRYRLLGYENRALANEDFREDGADAGEIGAGHTVTALYAVELAPGDAGPIAMVRLRAKPPGADADATERTFELPRGAIGPTFEASSRDHRMAVAAAMFAERLRGSPDAAGTRWATIEEIARSASRPSRAEDAELVGLIHRARVLSGKD